MLISTKMKHANKLIAIVLLVTCVLSSCSSTMQYVSFSNETSSINVQIAIESKMNLIQRVLNPVAACYHGRYTRHSSYIEGCGKIPTLRDDDILVVYTRNSNLPMTLRYGNNYVVVNKTTFDKVCVYIDASEFNKKNNEGIRFSKAGTRQSLIYCELSSN